MDVPKVIVIMSCYNHEKYVGEAIESILRQTYPHLELHIVNDGSTDNSRQIILSYAEKDERIRFYDFAKNTKWFGALRHLNQCIFASDAKYMAYNDSDDLWAVDKLEKQVKLLESHPEYKACFTYDDIFYEEGAPEYPLGQGYSHVPNISRYDWYRRFYFKGNCLSKCAMLMDRAIFTELGGFNASARAYSDYHMWVSLCAKYSFCMLPESLTYYRRHSTNMSDSEIALKFGAVTENYIFYRKQFLEMDKEFFQKVFYSELIYTDWDDPLQLEAEKVMLLLAGGQRDFEQIALDIFFENAAKPGFTELMETRYEFTTEKLSEIMNNCGLAAFGLDSPYAVQIAGFNRSQKLFDDASNETLTPDKLRTYPYSHLLFLLNVIPSEHAVKALDLLKKTLLKTQKSVYARKTKRKVVLAIGGDSQGVTESALEPWLKNAEDEFFYCLLPKKKDLFADEAAEPKGLALPSTVKFLDVYDQEERLIRPLKEVGVSPDMILFVDCLHSDYDWEKLIRYCYLDVALEYLSANPDEQDEPTRYIRELLSETPLYDRVGDCWSQQWENLSEEKIAWWHSDYAIRRINALVADIDSPIPSAGITQLLKNHLNGRKLKLGVSVGFGTGEKEIRLLEQGLVEKFMLFELSEKAVAMATANAEKAGLSQRVEIYHEDAFSHDFSNAEVDLVHWNNALHHMFDVDAAVKWSRDILVPGGAFYMDDYVGPNRFQNPEHALNLVNQIYADIPDKYKKLKGTELYKGPAGNIDPDMIEDPSEAVDSERILDAVKKHFPNAQIVLTGGLLYFGALTSLWANFDETDEEDRHILNLIMDADALLAKYPDMVSLYAVALAFK
jgi:glycosyltransferase involved in cell wall biosynthesis/SAM-dependent methyltransferase